MQGSLQCPTHFEDRLGNQNYILPLKRKKKGLQSKSRDESKNENPHTDTRFVNRLKLPLQPSQDRPKAMLQKCQSLRISILLQRQLSRR